MCQITRGSCKNSTIRIDYLAKISQQTILSTGNIKAGLPSFALPPFSINRTDVSNNTEWLSFPEICSELGAAIGLIPLIAILEQVAIAKAFGIIPS